MGGGMTGGEMMKSGDMMGCDMMGGGMDRMPHMMSMMREKLAHAGDPSLRSRPSSRSQRRKFRHGINSPMLFFSRQVD